MKKSRGMQRTRGSETALVMDYVEDEIDTSKWFCPRDPWVVKHRRACSRALKRLLDGTLAKKSFRRWLGDAIEGARSRIDHDPTWLDEFPEFAWVRDAKDAPSSCRGSINAKVFEMLRDPDARSQYRVICHDCSAEGH